MAMVWSHGDQYGVTFIFTPLFFFDYRFHHVVHIDIAGKMRRFMESLGIIFSLRRTQMRKVNPRTELFNHINQIVVCTHAIRASTHCEAIRHIVDGFHHPLHIFNGGDNTRQTKNWAWWIVRVNGHTYANLFCNRDDSPQEKGKVLAQGRFVYIFISRQVVTELVQRITFFSARQTCNNISCQSRFVLFAHGGEALTRLSYLFRGVIRLSPWTFENMQLKGGKLNLVKAQGF